MLRAPIWITSATSSTASMSRMSISSVTIGSPVSNLASASSRRPSCPSPWKAYREVIAADLAPVDVEHRALAVRDLRRGQLVGLQDRNDTVDAGLALKAETL